MTMKKTNTGLEIIQSADSTVQGRRVILTRKTTKAGEIRHGVVLESTRSGRHQKIGSFAGLAPAFRVYKALAQ